MFNVKSIICITDYKLLHLSQKNISLFDEVIIANCTHCLIVCEVIKFTSSGQPPHEY